MDAVGRMETRLENCHFLGIDCNNRTRDSERCGTALSARAVQAPTRLGGFSSVSRVLVLADLAGLLLAFSAAQLAFGRDVGRFPFGVELLLFLVTLPGWVLVAVVHDLYERDRAFADQSTPDELAGIFHLTTIGTWLSWIISWASGVATPDLPKLVAFWILATLLVAGARALVRTLFRRHSAVQERGHPWRGGGRPAGGGEVPRSP